MRSVLAASLIVASTALAQQSGDNERGGRLIFPPGAKEPLGEATPTPTPAPKRLETPAESIDAFFLALKAGQIDAAYDALVKGTIIADRTEDVTALKARTQQAIDGYGPVMGYELVDEQTVGTTLMRRTCISNNTDLPLRWRFYFYKSGGSWRLVDLRVDDALVELFEQSGRTTK